MSRMSKERMERALNQAKTISVAHLRAKEAIAG
jgi:hypothetical protein